MKALRTLTLCGVAALALSAIVAPIAQAEAPVGSSLIPSCVGLLEPDGPANAKGEVEATPVKIGCYPTPALAEMEGASAAAAGGNVWIGTDFGHIKFGGESWVWYAPSACSSSQGWKAAAMPAGWNDRVRSAIGNGNCRHFKHFEHINQGGASIDCGPTFEGDPCFGGMGVMTAQTSSLRWFN